MITKNIIFKASDGKDLLGYNWAPENASSIKGVIQIVHGMAETAVRYERFAKKLTENGYAVYAFDQRGHGKTAGSLDNVGYIADKDGMELMLEDQHLITVMIGKENQGKPILMFAHSMGSFVGQGYIQKYAGDLAGVVLSGTNGKQGLLLPIAKIMANAEVKKIGRKARSPKMTQLSFGSFNNAFKPNRTDFDWLSRDNTEVDKYINDPYCGGTFSAGFFADLTNYLTKVQRPEYVQKVPVDLPVFLIAGAKDPVSNGGKGVTVLYNTYRKLGLKDLKCKFYPDARHETLNETNRDEVMKDLIDWFDLHLKK